jgi:DNA primase catalytic subunit
MLRHRIICARPAKLARERRVDERRAHEQKKSRVFESLFFLFSQKNKKLLTMALLAPNTDAELFTKIVTAAGAFADREFAIFLENGNVLRSRHFSGVADLLLFANSGRDIRSINIGPVMKEGRRTERREIVLDIDVTDYAAICACEHEREKSACPHCWRYIQLAAHCLNRVLVDGYGIDQAHVHWFFSGNRGMHCFVSSPTHILRTKKDRANFVNTLAYTNEARPTLQQVALVPLIREFYADQIYPLHEQKLSASPKFISDEVLLELCWPRFDRAVTLDPTHLLRVPFGRHPTTRRYSQPVNGALLDFMPDFRT